MVNAYPALLPVRPHPRAFTHRAPHRQGGADQQLSAPLTSRPSRFPRSCLHHLAVQTKFLVFNIVAALGSLTCRHSCVQRQGLSPGYWPFRLGVMRGGKLSRPLRDPGRLTLPRHVLRCTRTGGRTGPASSSMDS